MRNKKHIFDYILPAYRVDVPVDPEMRKENRFLLPSYGSTFSPDDGDDYLEQAIRERDHLANVYVKDPRWSMTSKEYPAGRGLVKCLKATINKKTTFFEEHERELAEKWIKEQAELHGITLGVDSKWKHFPKKRMKSLDCFGEELPPGVQYRAERVQANNSLIQEAFVATFDSGYNPKIRSFACDVFTREIAKTLAVQWRKDAENNQDFVDLYHNHKHGAGWSNTGLTGPRYVMSENYLNALATMLPPDCKIEQDRLERWPHILVHWMVDGKVAHTSRGPEREYLRLVEAVKKYISANNGSPH